MSLPKVKLAEAYHVGVTQLVDELIGDWQPPVAPLPPDPPGSLSTAARIAIAAAIVFAGAALLGTALTAIMGGAN